MNEQYPQGIWNASEYFEQLTATNRLAKSERFTFCHVTCSGQPPSCASATSPMALPS